MKFYVHLCSRTAFNKPHHLGHYPVHISWVIVRSKLKPDSPTNIPIALSHQICTLRRSSIQRVFCRSRCFSRKSELSFTVSHGRGCRAPLSCRLVLRSRKVDFSVPKRHFGSFCFLLLDGAINRPEAIYSRRSKVLYSVYHGSELKNPVRRAFVCAANEMTMEQECSRFNKGGRWTHQLLSFRRPFVPFKKGAMFAIDFDVSLFQSFYILRPPAPSLPLHLQYIGSRIGNICESCSVACVAIINRIIQVQQSYIDMVPAT